MIRFGMKLPEIFAQLVRGYRKVTGRDPEGLDLIKIRQESLRRFEDMNKVVDMQGRSIDTSKGIMGGKQIEDVIDDLPPPGSRGGPDDIAAPVMNVEDAPPGFIDFVRRTDPKGADKLQKVEDEIKAAIEAANKRAAKKLRDKKKKKDDPEKKADGGRIGFKDGMDRRSFLKIMGGLAAIPVVGKFFKLAKTAKGIKSVPIVETAEVAGKPAWFDALVNKVIREGDDMTKQFATKEREIVHVKKLDEDTTVRVTQELDEGAVRVEYESPDNVFGDQVNLEYKKPLPDEGAPNPRAEFEVTESGPVGRQQSPDDYDIEIDEVGGNKIEDLTSDVSKLKEYATGKKPTMKEIVQNKKRKDKAANISNDSEAQMDDVIRRQGEMIDYDDYASGGIARMLGE
jgi:hypothetical protein